MKTFAYIGEEAVGRYVASRLEEEGLKRVDDMSRANMAFTYCLTTSLIEDAYFDDAGLVKNAQAGATLVDLSPSTPSFARELSAVALVNDLAFVEAPLAVNDPLAGKALSFENLACYAACEEDMPSEVLDILGLLAAMVIDAGEIGDAQLAKASHTVQMAAQVVAAVEASALARSMRGSAGLSAALARDGVAVGGVSRSVLEAIGADDFEVGCPIEYLMADVVAAMSAADDVDLILPQLEAAMHLLELMAVIGGADLGPAALALLYREESESAAHGLDWTRAEGLYEAQFGDADDYGHGHAHDIGDDGFGFSGGFGGYSEN